MQSDSLSNRNSEEILIIFLAINWVSSSAANGFMGHPQPILFPPSLFGQGLASVRLPCSLRNNAAAGLLRAPWNAV